MRLAYTCKNLVDVGRAITAKRALAERERWPRDRLVAFQHERLAALVEHASAASPFYRAHYGGPVPREAVRLDALPPVTKAMMMDRLDDVPTDPRLRAGVLERHLATIGTDDDLLFGEYRVMASSGSSGRKGIYVYDRAAWSHVLGGMMRATTMMGVTPRLPRRRLAQVTAPDAKHMTSRGASSMGVGVFDTLRLSATQPIDELVPALNRHRPEVLMGYPSILALLAIEQTAGRLRIAPAVVTTTSEVRSAEMTRHIREAWNVEPFNLLGLSETGITAVDCPEHRGLHLFEDTTLFEVVDERGRAVPADQPGHKVFVTNLTNRAQPFIRFEVTDLVTVTDDPCACGRTFRRITALEGRSDDILELPATAGGTVRVHPIHLRSPLAVVPGVAQYQIVQHPRRLEVAVMLAAGAAPERTAVDVERALGEALERRGVASVAVGVRIVERIAQESGAGKFKLIKAAPPAERGA